MKIFAGCLVVAMKMDPRIEIDREAIAAALTLTDRELLEAVDCVLECFPDRKSLNVDPNLMKEYIKPLLYSRSSPMLGGVDPSQQSTSDGKNGLF